MFQSSLPLLWRSVQLALILVSIIYQRCVLPRPLVLWKAYLNALAPTPDMDRLDVLPPQVAMSPHQLCVAPATTFSMGWWRPHSNATGTISTRLSLFFFRGISGYIQSNRGSTRTRGTAAYCEVQRSRSPRSLITVYSSMGSSSSSRA